MNCKTLYLICLILLLSCSNLEKNGSIQEYDNNIRNAMICYKTSQFSKSLNYFQKAFNLTKDENVSDYFFAAASALNIGDYDLAEDLIIDAIIYTNASKEYFESFSEFKDFREISIFEKIDNDYNSHITQFYENLDNKNSYIEIENLVKKDQEVRKNDAIEIEIHKVDSLNIHRLIEITKEDGWNKKGWILLWHQRGTFDDTNAIWDFFKPYIQNEIENGRIRKSFWCMFLDEKSILKNKKQIYGLYTSQYDQFPIADIENIDKIREKVGLPPLWYNELVYGIELPKEYRKPELKSLNL